MQRAPTRLAEISEQAQQLTYRWERLSAALTATESQTRLAAMRGILHTCLVSLVSNNLQVAYEHLNPGKAVDSQDSRIKEGMAIALSLVFNAKPCDFDNLPNLAMRIVAGGLFHHTAAFDILEGMEEALKDNADMDPMTAATLSSLRYVVRYLLDQTELKPLTKI